MQVLWSVLKSFVDQRNLSIQWIDLSDSYWMAAYDGPFKLECVMAKDSGSDQTDFETNYKSNGNQSPRGNVVQVLGKDSLTLCPFGAIIVPAAGTLTNCDVPLPQTMTLKGGVLFSSNSVIGDWITISVIDKDNVLGDGGTSDNPTVLGTYVISWYVMPGQINLLEDVSISQSLPQGVYMRIGYTSVGEVSPNVLINFISYIGTP